mmetsp:Transcript_11726/g.16269  ORF Transcript_11726/g.16269 Transcript_11726/m.16269 type:complete len:261 (+) Transcript_11726:85-867(+)
MGNTNSEEVQPQQEETCECGKPIEESCKYNPKLVGTVKNLYNRHIILCTGENDWPAKITKIEGTIAFELDKLVNAREQEIKSQVMITACTEPSRGSGMDIIVYPEAIRYIGVTDEQLQQFVEDQIVKEKICESIKHEKLTYKQFVMVCIHANRDKRCGRIGPMVLEKLGEILKAKLVSDDDIAVRGCSHLAGHKFAAVVVVYPQGDWYGMMSQRNAEDLVDAYLSKGKILSENWRGKMGETKEASKERLEQSTTSNKNSS